MSTGNDGEDIEEAIDRLKELGLKEYEAKCFVALSRVESATAKEISDHSEVPRTRVYDATRVLEAKGLVEVQHTNPQQFRAVPIGDAVSTLRAQFESQFRELQANLENLERPDREDDDEIHEVWSMAGSDAIAHRTQRLINRAEHEVVLVVGVEEILTEDLYATLHEAVDRGVTVIVGTLDESLKADVERNIDSVETFVSGLEWLRGESGDGETAIGRLLLVDRSNILVSSYEPSTREERAVFGRGFTNGLVLITRRLMATGHLPSDGIFGDG